MTCTICKRFLKNPVTLPCYCFACDEHLHDDFAKSKSLKCLNCNRDFQIPESGFASNKVIASILSKELHLSDEEKTLKNLIKDLIQQLLKLQPQNGVDSMQNDMELLSFDHFSELKRKVDMQREALKTQIDQIALKMIDQINEKEKKYKIKVNELILEIKDKSMLQKNEALLDQFRDPNLVIANIQRELDEQKTKIQEFKSNVGFLENLNEEIKSFEFLATEQAFPRDSFGILKLDTPTKLISCSLANDIKIWDLATNECLATLEGHSLEVWCLEKISSHTFASGSHDKTIKIWDIRQNVCLKTLTGHQNVIGCLKSLTPNTLASGSINEIKIWNLANGACVQTLTHTGHIRCFIRLDNGCLVSCSDDATIKIWDLAQGLCLKTLTGHASAIYCLILLEKGRFASGSLDKTIKIWNIDNGECIRTLMGHSSYVWRLQLLNGKLISSSADSTIKIWDLENGKCIQTMSGHTSLVWSIKTSPNNTLISCSLDGSIKKWDLESGTCINTFIGNSGKGMHDLLII